MRHLVQPNRDLGAVHVHSIIPAMVQAAPTFDQVLPDIAASEQGRVDLHAGYYDKLVERILADVIIVDEEALLSEMVADALNLEPQADTRKAYALKLVTDHVGANWDAGRPPSPSDLRKTLVVEVPLTEASAKVRRGDPIDEPEDIAGPWWAGVVPVTTRCESPSTSADLPAIPDPRRPWSSSLV